MAERNSYDERVGVFLAQNGITSAMLLSHDSAELSPIEVTNGVVLDLYCFYQHIHRAHSIHSKGGWLHSIHSEGGWLS